MDNKTNFYRKRFLFIFLIFGFMGCSFNTDISLKDNLESSPGDSSPPSPSISIKTQSAPIDLSINIDESNRIIDISNIRRGTAFEISFLESDINMTNLSCTSPPDYIQILDYGFKIQAPLKNTNSENVNFFCDTNNGNLEFRLTLNLNTLGILSTAPVGSNVSPHIGGPNNEWYLYTSTGSSLDGFSQILIQHTQTKEVKLISTPDGLNAGFGISSEPQFSVDGTKIIFHSKASNFPAANGQNQIYMKDFTDLSALPILISGADATIPGLSSSYSSQFSPDGTKIVFFSDSSNFSFANGQFQIYVKDLSNLSSPPLLISGTDASTPGSNLSATPQFSPDGTKIVFRSSASNFPGANTRNQIYLKDFSNLSSLPVLISGTDASTPGLSSSYNSNFSPDGTKIIFESYSSNFQANNGQSQIYLKDLSDLSNPPVLISGTDASTAGLNTSSSPHFSPDGTKIIFRSSASNFIGTNTRYQLYIKNFLDLSIPPILISGTDTSTAGLDASYSPQFFSDGTKIIFRSTSSNFNGANGQSQIYVKNLLDLSSPPLLISEIKSLSSGTTTSSYPQISSDGTKIIFQSSSSNFSGHNTYQQIYLKDITDLLSSPVLISGTDASTPGLASSYNFQFSDDGTKVIFESNSSTFSGANGSRQIYLKDLSNLSNPPVLISGADASTSGLGSSSLPQFSSDGNKILFESSASNFSGANIKYQIYTKDYSNLSNPPVLISGSDTSTPGDNNSSSAQFSPDGTKIVFQSNSSNFAGQNGYPQIYVKDLTNLSNPPVLISGLDSSTAGNNGSYVGYFSPDGSKIVFVSIAFNFPGANAKYQIYVKDYTDLSSPPVLISAVDSSTAGLDHSSMAQFSPDGNKIVFFSKSSNFSGSNGKNQIYIKDYTDLSLAPVLVSTTDTSEAGLDDSSTPMFSPDGSKIIFSSKSLNFPNANGQSQIYIKLW